MAAPMKTDIPDMKEVKDGTVEIKDPRIPNSAKDPKGPSQKVTAARAPDPQGYIHPGHDTYLRMFKTWRENKQPGTLIFGGKDWQVIKPDGHPVFVPLNTSLDSAYGSTSGNRM